MVDPPVRPCKKALPSLDAPVPPVRQLLQKARVDQRIEERGAAIEIDAAKPRGLVGRYMRPRHFSEDAT